MRACNDWRGELAARALGVPSPDIDAALDAHLDGCADCRAELADLRTTADALRLADAERSGVPDPGPALADQIVARITRERTSLVHRRRRLIGAGAAAAVAVAAIIAVGLATANDAEDTDLARIELVGSEGSSGSARLEARPWGTEVTLDVSGLDDGEIYWLWLTDETGDRVGAGTMTGTADASHATFASALPTAEARRVWITDAEDRVVLDATIDQESLPGR